MSDSYRKYISHLLVRRVAVYLALYEYMLRLARYYRYDSNNRLVRVIDPQGKAASYTYDASGNKTSETDANGNVTRYEYNYKGQLINVIGPMDDATTYTYGGAGCASCG